MSQTNVFFAPQLFIPSGITDVSFYTKAFGAVEHRIWRNDDGSVHVVEFIVGEAIFQLHEERPQKGQLASQPSGGTTVLIGLFVPDVDAVISKALKAGAQLLNPAQDYDYGYRQGVVQDPFGHQWMIEKRI